MATGNIRGIVRALRYFQCPAPCAFQDQEENCARVPFAYKKSLLAVLFRETLIRVVISHTNLITKTATGASFWGRRRVSHEGM
jgi:hypothetical protein